MKIFCIRKRKRKNWKKNLFIIQYYFLPCCRAKPLFTMTAEIHARSLANFYCQYANRHMNLKFMRRVSEREPAIRQFVIVENKLMSVFNASVLLLIMNSFHPNIVKVVCGSTRLSPLGSTATLTTLWRNSWSVTRQTHVTLTSICLKERPWRETSVGFHKLRQLKKIFLL